MKKRVTISLDLDVARAVSVASKKQRSTISSYINRLLVVQPEVKEELRRKV